MRRLTTPVALAAAALAFAPATAGAHSLVRVNGPELAYISADATSLNTLQARVSGGEYELRDPTVDGGSDPGSCRPGDISDDANGYIIQVFCRSAGIERARVDLGEREDSATIALPIPVTLLGGPGADRLTTGVPSDQISGGDGNDVVRAGGGADTIDGGAGVDALDGEAGDDLLRTADGLSDRVACGSGSDRVEADTVDEVAGDCESVSRTAVAPPPEAAGTGSDAVAPVVRAGAYTLQRLTRSGRVRVLATSSERGHVSASGFLQTRGANLPISSDRREVGAAGGGATLTVRLRGRSLREARRAIARRRPATVRLAVVGTDAAGNSAQARAPRIRLVGARASAGTAVRSVAVHPEPGDVDGDGVRDENDNCVNHRNGDQRDTDGDGAGDACDPDADGDGFYNDGREPQDNCAPITNPDQRVNPCTEDPDGDGIPTYRDNCFDVPNRDQRNYDLRFTYGDAQGDVCDPDDDGDGVFDDRDNCPLVENPDQTDADGDGLGYLCDADDTPRPAGPDPGGPGGGPGDSTAPGLKLALPRKLRLTAVEGGVPVRVSCSEGCAATVRLHAGRSLARRLRVRGNRMVAAGTAQVDRAATTYAFLRFPRAVKRRAWRMRSLRLTVRAEAVDRAGNRATAVRTVTLVR